MKEATGELNMTVVTIIAIGAVIAFFWVMWPKIRSTIEKTWGGVQQETCVEWSNGKCVEYETPDAK